MYELGGVVVEKTRKEVKVCGGESGREGERRRTSPYFKFSGGSFLFKLVGVRMIP